MERRRKRATDRIRLTLYSRMLQLIGFQNSQMDSNHRFKKLQISIRINTKKLEAKDIFQAKKKKYHVIFKETKNKTSKLNFIYVENLKLLISSLR